MRGSGYTVAGMAKGAGMLAPDMATMLAFLTTDAEVAPATLADLLRIAVRDSFNTLTVDGCTSTNDTVVLMASGRSGPADPNVLVDSVTEACSALAPRWPRTPRVPRGWPTSGSPAPAPTARPTWRPARWPAPCW